MCSDHRRARRTVSTRLEVAIQFAFQEKFSYAKTFQVVLGGGSMMVRRMRDFTVTSEMGRGGVSVVVAAACANSLATSLPGMPA